MCLSSTISKAIYFSGRLMTRLCDGHSISQAFDVLSQELWQHTYFLHETTRQENVTSTKQNLYFHAAVKWKYPQYLETI